MRIHVSTTFENKDLIHHFEFEVDVFEKQIPEVKNRLAKLAIDKLKEICISKFKTEFDAMKSISIYYFSGEKEVIIFEKVKS